MTSFRCHILSAEGQPDWRVVDAPSAERAAAKLISEGLTPLDIRSGKLGISERLNRPVRLGGTLGLNEQALILSQLATLINAGLPVDRSLDLLRDQLPRARQRAMLAAALADVRAGESLASAFDRAGGFPRFAIGILRAAERSGDLGRALSSIAERLALVATTRQQLVTALTYPAAVLVATCVALILVLTIVVPQFAPVFAGQEDRLPGLTRIVLLLSSLVSDHGWGLAAGLLVIGAAATLGVRTGMSTSISPRWVSRLPGMALRDQHLSAQFAGLMGTLLSNGVTVVRALPLAREALSSRRWNAYLSRAEERVREGSRLSAALAINALLPTTAIRLIEVGETSGNLAMTCTKASSIMGAAARAKLDRIVTLANPIAIINLGGVVAALVAGVMLGLFSLGDFAG